MCFLCRAAVQAAIILHYRFGVKLWFILAHRYISVFGWWYIKVWYDGDTTLHVIPSKLTVTEAENNKKIIGSKKGEIIHP